MAWVVRDRIRARLRLAAYRACAERREGVVYEPAWGTGALGFEVRCAGRILRCTERTISTGEGLRFHTDVRLAFAPGDASIFRLRIATRHALESLPRLYGMAESGARDVSLDGPLVVQSTQPAFLARVLSPGVREALKELVRTQAGADLVVAVDGEGVLVTTDRRLADCEAIDAHLDTCIELFGPLLGALGLRPAAATALDANGVVLLPNRAEGCAPSPICQVCGHPLDANPVRCQRCSTPHHSECWAYNGRCATYGCGGRSTA